MIKYFIGVISGIILMLGIMKQYKEKLEDRIGFTENLLKTCTQE